MKAIFLKKILPFSLFLLLFSFAHPFYLGVVSLEYNAKEKMLQGSVKLFVNDLEDALKKSTKKPVDLIHVKDTLGTSALLMGYLSSHFRLQVNGAAVKYELLGFELEEEALWMYVEYKCETPKKIQIQNTLLFDYLPNQSNIVHIDVNGTRKSAKTTNPDKDFVFEF
jgi:hypothetical protein